MTALSESIRIIQQFVPPSPSGRQGEAPPFNHFSQPDEWELRIDELLDIRRLQNDWDGLGAPAPATTVVDSALALAQLLRRKGCPPPCRIIAGLTGAVLFEWQNEEGSYSELEMSPPGRAEWILMIPGQPTRTDSIAW